MLAEFEIKEIIEVILAEKNYDFRNYAKSSFSRRIMRFMALHNLNSKEELIKFIIETHDFNKILEEITVNTTELFRDPSFWKVLKNEVLPLLNSHQKINIWHAACSSGEEVISMQIILRELELEHKVLTYATDIDSSIIKKAMNATYSKKHLPLYHVNYTEAGGEFTLEKYFSSQDNQKFTFKKELLENVIFKKFDLVKDLKYNKFDLIICRNVLIYFDFELQERVIDKFVASLFSQGFIAIGQNETILSNNNLAKLNLFDSIEKIYRNIK